VSCGVHADQGLHGTTTLRCSKYIGLITCLFVNVDCVLCCVVLITAGTSQGLGSTCSLTRCDCLC